VLRAPAKPQAQDAGATGGRDASSASASVREKEAVQ